MAQETASQLHKLAIGTILGVATGFGLGVTVPSYFTQPVDFQGGIQAESITGSTLDITGTATGVNLNVEDTAGSGTLSLFGIPAGGANGSGGVLCIEDTDGAGWTLCDVLNGTMTCATTTTQCPKS